MRLSCLAILLLLFGLVGFDGIGAGPASGQVPTTAPTQLTPAPQAAPPVSALPSYGPMTAFPGVNEYQPAPANPFFTNLVADSHSSKERELDRQSHDLARQYARTENRDEREKLRDKLNDTLKQQFDAQQQRRKDEIKQIEDQLKKLRELMQKREDSKSSIVQRRLEQLLQEADGLGWTSSEPLFPRAPQAVPPATSKAPSPKR
jgi:hypothetical protein